MRNSLYIFLFALFLGAYSLSAQNDLPPHNQEEEEYVPVPDNPTVDTIEVKNPSPVDTLKRYTMEELMLEKEEAEETVTLEKNPMGGVWRSIAVPGWGQLYYENYWKAPLFFAGAVTLYGLIIYNNVKFVDYSKKANAAKGTNDYDYYYDYREFYRSNRDQAGLYLLGVYILSAVDAYVGAHLFNFNVSEELSLQTVPNRYGGVSLNLTYNIK